MNSDKETKNGGASIKPSARSSIHSHRGCIFLKGEKMTRYGLDLDKDNLDDNLQGSSAAETKDLGRDEVDNAHSKFARTPSPLTVRHITQKRQSLDGGATYTDDSDVSSKLAKSLPARLESLHSLSSDEIGNRSSSSPLNRSTNIIHWLENKTPMGSNYYSASGTPRPNSFIHDQSTRVEPKSHQPIVLFMGFLCLAVAVVWAVQNGSLPNSFPAVYPVSDTYNTAKFYDELNSLRGKYKITDDTILQLKTGISTIFKRHDTGSFVLVYKSNRYFDHNKLNILVNAIAAAAAKYLRNESTSVQHIVVEGSKLEMRSHSELITKYRDDVTRTGVMLVLELDEVPSALAMAFHYYCDEYNPLVKKSAIFFTLDMAKCSHISAEQNPTHAQIEKCLKQKWSGVPKDNISPLLNRVVSTVVNIAGV